MSRVRAPLGPPIKIPQIVWGIFVGTLVSLVQRLGSEADKSRGFGGARTRTDASIEHATAEESSDPAKHLQKFKQKYVSFAGIRRAPLGPPYQKTPKWDLF